MQYYLLPAAFLISSVSLFFIRKGAFAFRLWDSPGHGALKIHKNPTPYLGGIGIFIGFSLVLALSFILYQTPGKEILFSVLLGSLMALLLGLWDDTKWGGNNKPALKFFLQFLIAFIAGAVLVKEGVSFPFVLPWTIALPALSLYLIGGMNAINMEDGMDGIAGTLAGISLMGFASLALVTANLLVLTLALSLLGAVLGFLLYNWHPASLFMGDNGSHFLGFTLALLAVRFTGNPTFNVWLFLSPIFIIGLPVIDAAWTIIRRVAKQKSPIRGDREHLYDIMHRQGFTIPMTTLLYCGIQIILVALGIGIYLIG